MSNKVTLNKNLERIAKKIKDKYKKHQQKKKKNPIRKASKKAINRMKKSNYLQTDDEKTVDYNNDANLENLETIDYNNDTNLDELETTCYNSDTEIKLTTAPKISTAQQQVAEKIVKKYKNLTRKEQPIIYAKTNKKNKEGDFVFIKKYLFIQGIDLPGLLKRKNKRKKLSL